jgi:hypothetical protein
MYRLARVHDLIDARCRNPQDLFTQEDFVRRDDKPVAVDASSHYSIKQMGSFFCAQHLRDRGPGAVLEAGAGFSPFFARRFAPEWEYWAIDDVGFYDEELLRRGRDARPPHKFIEGLLGSRSEGLPDSFFDVVFSVSVLEHVPYGEIYDVCRDMRRVTKTGGLSVHSIDVTPETSLTRGQRWLHGMLGAGFELVGEVGLDWWQVHVAYERQPLLEPLPIVYEVYGGPEARQFTEPVVRPYLVGTVLAAFRAV